ncbi:RipA family octameric membrane protein [Yokenella regensburgei]|uniref:Uncharacterized protein n=1 Tax=Yokenella regensburgei TaxID=158877 RepID=A0AB38FQR8_9ENTR|nr:hypothetical protein [Yokenella regensburgei]KFD19197.1 hypothetical protein GYRE_04401 [Yokenella regensburgei ATCC 49455]SQA60230.1 Uncharacterised protein [Yokenella regensburgei]SQA67724.1 Uncharacterised protein [Yokenella regensburgei]SUQ06037.1 Uncharacterised protein [Yokenella regensburgei]
MWKCIKPHSVQTASSTYQETSDVDPYHQEYIDQNRIYFNKLLGSRLSGKSKVTLSDIAILKEAYDKAHSIRNFEIELFWKRASYCFTIIAALITLCGVLASTYFKPNISERDHNLLLLIAFISFLGVVFTIMSHLMMVSGEYWKRNWELHISMLEPLFSGRIYSTHLVSSENRTSISRMLLLFFMAIYVCWLVILGFVLKENENFIIPLFVILIASVVYIVIFTFSKNKTQDVFVTSYFVRITHKDNISGSLKKFINKFLVISLFTSTYGLIIFLSIMYYKLGNVIFSVDFLFSLF